jgi:hypothetical protein
MTSHLDIANERPGAGDGGDIHGPTADAAATADIDVITDYLMEALPPEEMLAVNDRFVHDARFRANVTPLLALVTVPQRYLRYPRALRRLGFGRPSERAGRKEWERFLALADKTGAPATAGEKETPEKKRRERKGYRRKLWIAAGAVVVIAAGWAVKGGMVAWRVAVAETKAGHELPPFSAFLTPTTYDARDGEERVVQTPLAEVTLHGPARLAIGLFGYGAIDGEANITVPGNRKFVLHVAGLSLGLSTGRYRISHPFGAPTVLYVDDGQAAFVTHSWGTGTVITAFPRDSMTTITAVDATGQDLTPVTTKNHFIRP